MTDYWKSSERKYCDFCKCWISANKANVSFHENGKRHKLNVSKRITEISRNSEKSEREKQKLNADLRKMDEAAMRSYAQDIHSRADMTARSIGTVMDATMSEPTTSASSSKDAGNIRHARQIDPMRLPGSSDEEGDGGRVTLQKVTPDDVPNASLWVEGKTNDGYTYYWNVKSNESVWEKPKEGYLSYAEYERINQLAVRQQEMSEANEAKKFRDNVDEEVARYNRERMKNLRKPDTAEEAKAKREEKAGFKTEEEAAAPEIGTWQVVEDKPPPKPIDWELPQVDNYYAVPAVPEIVHEPPVKRFKEKTIETLDPEFAGNTATTFKKRKFAARGNPRKRLTDD